MTFARLALVVALTLVSVGCEQANSDGEFLSEGESSLAAPTLRVVSTSSTSIALAWTQVTGAAGYRVWRRVDANGASWTKLDDLRAVLSYADGRVTSGTSYRYTVRSLDSSGAASAASNVVTATASAGGGSGGGGGGAGGGGGGGGPAAAVVAVAAAATR